MVNTEWQISIQIIQRCRNTITYHHRDLVVLLFSQVYQVEVVVEQVIQAAMEVLVGQDGFLKSMALDSSQT